MIESSPPKNEWIRQQALRFDQALSNPPLVWRDTTDYMAIERDHVVDLEGTLFLVRCNEHEGRFGIDDQPKFWVKRALNLHTGKMYILKLGCQEEFKIRVGSLPVRCVRSAEKEGRVLELVRGDARFMQGYTARDARGNLVRVIDFIPGIDLLSFLHSLTLGHEEYSQSLLPGILAKITDSLRGIQLLHDEGLCHGDIRNDHLLVERESGRYRWIDFDLNQDFSDFDVWSVGNILHCVAAKGFVTFRDAIREQPQLSGQLSEDDASVFFAHRVMNLRMVYPYLPAGLNEILLKFSAGTRVYYDKVSQIADDLAECAASLGWEWSAA